MTARPMTLCLFLASTGYHSASWRAPSADPLANIHPGHFTALAQHAESAGFDAVFLADSMAVWSDPGSRPVGAIEPAVLATAILQATKDIGVIITQSTSYNEPFNVARRLSSLDHLGGGRIGWNIVTSATKEAAQNFGLPDIPDHGTRYRRADEFVRVCVALWNSWDPDAIIADRTGWWARPEAIRPIDHTGEFFSVRGPLDVPPSPQRVPLLVQAGSSDAGIGLAAAHADLVFTVQSDFAAAHRFRQRVRTAAAQVRSTPIRVLPGLIPIVGSTMEEAERRLAELDALIDPAPAISQLEKSLALEPDSLRPEDTLPAGAVTAASAAGNTTYREVIRSMAEAGRTAHEIARVMSVSRGHRLLVGTPESIAADMCEWTDRHAADGYIVTPALLPSDFELFVDQVVPLLGLGSPSPGPLADRYRKVDVPR